jgi:hypothetical protein
MPIVLGVVRQLLEPSNNDNTIRGQS